MGDFPCTESDVAMIRVPMIVFMKPNNEANRRRAGIVWLMPQCLPGVRLGAQLDGIRFQRSLVNLYTKFLPA
jgi:hypothetical protein